MLAGEAFLERIFDAYRSATSQPGTNVWNTTLHTSLIATLRKTWGLGPAFTQRDASARTFDHIFTRSTPRDPQTWATIQAQPVPAPAGTGRCRQRLQASAIAIRSASPAAASSAPC
jgi:hypothetical protein